MNSDNLEVNSWYETLKRQALERNDQSVITWSKYKDDLEQTKSLLALLPKKLKHDVMVPVGPKALMRGQIIHTNEFLVNLGETWFVKRTASQTGETCDRRIKTCKEMLEKLEKERELIVSKSTLPAEQDAFGNEERLEIIEYVTEEENKEWKKEHRKREKEYRQQLAAIRNKERKPIETEEDLWKHLDELELQEELEDELNRLNAENSTDEEISENESELNTETNEQYSSVSYANENTKKEGSVNNTEKNEVYKPKRKVSFACDLESSDDEPLILEIKHSDVEPSYKFDKNSNEINSPSDIYENYLLNKTPLSVLKSDVNPNKEKELKRIEKTETETDSSEEEQYFSKTKIKATSIQFNDVTERHPNDTKAISIEQPKKISKFKASRAKN